MERGLTVPKFSGSDFSVWKIKFEALAQSKNLEKCLTEIKPEEAVTKALFEKNEGEIKSMLLLALDDRSVRLILNCQTVKTMWDRLIEVYQHKSTASKLLLQKEFFELNLNMVYIQNNNQDNYNVSMCILNNKVLELLVATA